MPNKPNITRPDTRVLILAALLACLLACLATLLVGQIGRISECNTLDPRPSVSSSPSPGTPSPTVPTPRPSWPSTGGTFGGGNGQPPTMAPSTPSGTGGAGGGLADDAGGV